MRFHSSVLASIIIAALPAKSQTVLTPVFERTEIYREGMTRAGWNGNVLIGMEKNQSSSPIIWTLGRSGNKEEITYSIPGAATVWIENLAGSSDGTIVAVGMSHGHDGQRAGFVGIIAPDRGKTTIVPTTPYIPSVVTIAPDGVIWTVGGQFVDEKPTHNILKRFSGSGKLLSSEIVKVRAGNVPDVASNSSLRASKDRVGWLTSGPEYLEFWLDGHETNRFPGPPWEKTFYSFATLALRDDYQVVAADMNMRMMWTLDRVKRDWNPVQVAGESLRVGNLFGFDGDQLVVGSHSKDRGFLLVHFVLSP